MRIDLPTGWYQAFWWSWLGILGLAFVVAETLALLDRDRGDTLTETLRPVIQATPVGWILGGLFFGWLFAHFVIDR